MTNPADLAELLERVKAASGPDRELDAAIVRAFGWVRTAGNIANSGSWRRHDRSWLPVSHEAVTASLDAALALVEQALPGAFWRIEKLTPAATFDGEPYWASCGPAGAQECHHGKTRELALLAAMLSALVAAGSGIARTK